ncbi:MAG: response regulator [Bacteroidia bacterium]
MNKKLKSVMLIDDNTNDNFFHAREIKKNNPETIILTMNDALTALEYLKSNNHNGDKHPDLIFLDINMPGMNGWDFLKEYNLLDTKLQSQVIIIMLSTSKNREDEAKSKTWSFVSDYIKKPLTKEKMKVIIETFFT